MKKALTIALTLISGIVVNGFVGIGLWLFTWGMHIFGMLLIWLAAFAAVTALLSLAAWKLSGIVNDAAFILCAQFPSVIFMAVRLVYSHDSVQDVLPLAASAAAALAAFTVSELTYNKGRLEKWLSDNFGLEKRVMKKPLAIVLLSACSSAALLAGAFALLPFSWDDSWTWLVVAFVICAVLAVCAELLRKRLAARGIGTLAFMISVYGVPLAVWGAFCAYAVPFGNLEQALTGIAACFLGAILAVLGLIVLAVSTMISRKRAGLTAFNKPIALSFLLIVSAAVWTANMYICSLVISVAVTLAAELVRRCMRAKLGVKDVPYFICAYLPLAALTVYGVGVEFDGDLIRAYIINAAAAAVGAAIWRAVSAVYDRRKERKA